MKRVRPTPLGALARGLVAGVVGSAVQSLFFKLTKSFAPTPHIQAFTPPELAQLEEQETETIAHRFVESMMQRRLSSRGKKIGATIVHYAFGALWGGLYGLARESLAAARRPTAAIAFGGAVWLLGDELLVPAFRLSASPGAYPLKTHAYAFGAHAVYGAAAWATYEALRPRSLAVAAAALWALRMDLAIEPRLPRAVRPIARAAICSAARVRARRPLAIAAEALRAP